jgi:hypothetical protein
LALFSVEHYKFLADWLHEELVHEEIGQDLIIRFCRALAADNPTFDPVRFSRRAINGKD